ncbi:hypothetical protein Ancab_028592 [Ancistrocladus abbreviatus]
MAETAEKSDNQDPHLNENAQALKKAKRKLKEVYPFGNYRNYYGYRVGQDMEEDPRFTVFKKEWFEAKKFRCRTILGIDIDHDRIEDAEWSLKKFVKKKARNGHSDAQVKVVEGVNGIEYAESTSLTKDQRGNKNDGSTQERSLLDIVSFRCENFVESWRPLPLEHYDTIVCLSVTKWVHLNWGDEGLIRLFAKMWRLLHPGGILVLEPQPWKSYCSKRLVTETAAVNFQKITCYPKYFQEILLDKIGFRSVENAASRIPGTKTGFNRPVLVFRK